MSSFLGPRMRGVASGEILIIDKFCYEIFIPLVYPLSPDLSSLQLSSMATHFLQLQKASHWPLCAPIQSLQLLWKYIESFFIVWVCCLQKCHFWTVFFFSLIKGPKNKQCFLNDPPTISDGSSLNIAVTSYNSFCYFTWEISVFFVPFVELWRWCLLRAVFRSLMLKSDEITHSPVIYVTIWRFSV